IPYLFPPPRFAGEDEGGGLIDLNGLNVLNGFLVALPPLIHRHGLLIVASHDPPIAVGLAADHDDVNLVRLEPFYHFMWRRFYLRRVSFFAKGRSRVNIILYDLIIPVLASRHQSLFVNPVDELFLDVETASVDKLSGRDRVEHEGRSAMRVHATQHAAHVLAPILLANPQREGRGATASKDADRTIGGFEAVLYMKWLPRAALFVLGEGHGPVGVTVPLRAHVAVPRQGAALEIL